MPMTTEEFSRFIKMEKRIEALEERQQEADKSAEETIEVPRTQIDEIIQEFDFNKVQNAMIALDWTWKDGPKSPSISQLKLTARELLDHVSKQPHSNNLAQGGLLAEKDEGGDLCLSFVVTEWQTGECK